MPIGFLTTTECHRLNRFPAQIPDEDLRVFFLLSDADQTAINHQREAPALLGDERRGLVDDRTDGSRLDAYHLIVGDNRA